MPTQISRWPRILATFLLALEFSSLSLADDASEVKPFSDRIVLNSGTQIFCKVIEVRDGVASIETEFADSISIDMEHVASISSSESVAIKLSDQVVIEDTPLRIENGYLEYLNDSGERNSLVLDEALLVNPEPWEMGYGYNWTGSASLALKIERGNSKIEDLDYRVDSVWRSLDDRYTVNIRGELDRANDQVNSENTALVAKYDRFLENDRYWGVQGRAYTDEFQDIDLRYLVGPYYGVQFYTLPIFTLSGEVGASYVNEKFTSGGEQDYPAGNWSINISSDILGGESRLFLDQLGVISLEDTEDVLLFTTTGLTMPLQWGLEVTAEILLEYDAAAPPGVEKLDETYNLRVGYAW